MLRDNHPELFRLRKAHARAADARGRGGPTGPPVHPVEDPVEPLQIGNAP
jgi:hypothetical protein